MKVLSLFSGVGAFEMALKRLDVDFELVNYCEIDKFASKSYSAIHGVSEDMNLWDVTTINTDTLPGFDLMTWGFPCQDISVAGKGAGIEQGTRSGLYYEGLRILQAKKPKYSIVENVKNLVGKKFRDKYLQMLDDFHQAGYNSYSRVLNAKDYGIPQNRERVFIISIRKDVDPYANTLEGYPWPLPFGNGLRLKDFLESEVDEKFYIGEEKTARLIEQLKDKGKYHSQEYSYAIDSNYFKGPSQADLTNGKRQTVIEPQIIDDRDKGFNGTKLMDYCPTQRANRYGLMVTEPNQCNCIGRIDIKRHDYLKRVYSPEGCSPTISACGGGNLEPKTVVPCLTPDRVNKRQNGRRFKDDGDPSFTFTSQDRHGVMVEGFRIRKLTPRECWRLMGFTDTDFDKAQQAGISNSQLYKQAGNSIVVDVLMHIMKPLTEQEAKQ